MNRIDITPTTLKIQGKTGNQPNIKDLRIFNISPLQPEPAKKSVGFHFIQPNLPGSYLKAEFYISKHNQSLPSREINPCGFMSRIQIFAIAHRQQLSMVSPEF